MRTGIGTVLLLLAGILPTTHAADWGLEKGNPQLQSAGPLAFGPDGILLVGDTKAARVFAIDTGDAKGNPETVDLRISNVQQGIAEALGAQEVAIKDMAANPLSGQVYFSVMAGSDPALVRVTREGQLERVSLENVGFTSVTLPDAPEDAVTGEGRRQRNRRDESITDIAFAEGRVLVSGLTNQEAPSSVREIPFPFTEADRGTPIELYHGAHGRYEDYAAVRTFVPFMIDGEPNVLAGFTCTPLVKFPVGQLGDQKIRGTTLAELGNRNQPLDMIVYEQNGEPYLLLANSARGVMKISTKDLDRDEGITQRIADTAGQPYETISQLEGVVQLDRLNSSHAVVLMQEGDRFNLETVPLP